MASNNETVADIIAEVRTINPFNEYADFIEAAHKRELAVKDAEIAELRECLKEAIYIKCGYCRDFYRNCPTICDVNKKDCDIIAKFRRALAFNVNEEL